jgi:hypothetical protein
MGDPRKKVDCIENDPPKMEIRTIISGSPEFLADYNHYDSKLCLQI